MMEKHEAKCTCGLCDTTKQRKGLSILCSEEEMIELQLIQTRNNCAMQAMHLQSIPNGVSERDVNLFVKAAIEARADALVMESCWWKKMYTIYNLKNYSTPDSSIYIDTSTREFYVVIPKE